MAFVYSCCFWFSLRLGGILIGTFSIVHAIIVLVVSCIAYSQPEDVKQEINEMMKNINLIYVISFLEKIKEDPETYITVCISFLCIYVTVCILYIYGAFKCNNTLMVGFILMEFLRLIILTFVVIIWLLVIKQNTMDIGLVIGASVASGFVLYIFQDVIPYLLYAILLGLGMLIYIKRTFIAGSAIVELPLIIDYFFITIVGMFYLWICAANLPILINEIKREEQLATTSKTQRLLQIKNSRYRDSISLGDTYDFYRRDVFVIPRYKFVNPWNYLNYPLSFI